MATASKKASADGDAALRAKYQAEIEKVKKLESLNAQLLNKMKLLAEESESLRTQLLSYKDVKDHAIDIARRAQEEVERIRRDELTERERIASNMQKVADDVGEKFLKIVEENKTAQKENLILRERLDSMAKGFEGIKSKYEETLRLKDQERKAAEEKLIHATQGALNKADTIVTNLQNELKAALQREAAAKSELDGFTMKFAEIQKMMESTATVIQTQKKDQAKMLQMLKDSEAEKKKLVQRCSDTETEMKQVLTESKAVLERHETQAQVIEKLKSLSRVLQNERNHLSKRVTSVVEANEAFFAACLKDSGDSSSITTAVRTVFGAAVPAEATIEDTAGEVSNASGIVAAPDASTLEASLRKLADAITVAKEPIPST